MTFFVPDDEIRFEKHYVLREPSAEESSNPNVEKTIIDGQMFVEFDPQPNLPDEIDGVAFKALTDEEQGAYWLVEKSYLFEYKDEGSYGPTNEEPISSLFLATERK